MRIGRERASEEHDRVGANGTAVVLGVRSRARARQYTLFRFRVRSLCVPLARPDGDDVIFEKNNSKRKQIRLYRRRAVSLPINLNLSLSHCLPRPVCRHKVVGTTVYTRDGDDYAIAARRPGAPTAEDRPVVTTRARRTHYHNDIIGHRRHNTPPPPSRGLTAAAAAQNRGNPPSPSQMRPSVVSLGRPPSVRSPATVLLLLAAAALLPNAVLSVESSTDSKREYFRLYGLPK